MAVLHDSFLIGLVICCDRFVIMTGLFYINHLRIIITSSIVYSDVKASEHLFIIIHHRWSTLVSKLHSIYSSSSLQRSTKTGTVQFFETLRPPVLILLQRRLLCLSSQVDSSIGTAQHQNQIADTQCCDRDATADIASASYEKRDYRMFSSFFPASGGLLFVYDIGFPVHQ